ncbi:hypothetical protein R1flu_022784 [Riccia fluitans]|uniref:Uncharacterized protein n=1 Tax=Riccia fluitans TaxID=41844 RepID=A0ABD1XQ64_9MARC
MESNRASTRRHVPRLSSKGPKNATTGYRWLSKEIASSSWKTRNRRYPPSVTVYDAVVEKDVASLASREGFDSSKVIDVLFCKISEHDSHPESELVPPVLAEISAKSSDLIVGGHQEVQRWGLSGNTTSATAEPVVLMSVYSKSALGMQATALVAIEKSKAGYHRINRRSFMHSEAHQYAVEERMAPDPCIEERAAIDRSCSSRLELDHSLLPPDVA